MISISRSLRFFGEGGFKCRKLHPFARGLDLFYRWDEIPVPADYYRDIEVVIQSMLHNLAGQGDIHFFLLKFLSKFDDGFACNHAEALLTKELMLEPSHVVVLGSHQSVEHICTNQFPIANQYLSQPEEI